MNQSIFTRKSDLADFSRRQIDIFTRKYDLADFSRRQFDIKDELSRTRKIKIGYDGQISYLYSTPKLFVVSTL